MTPGMFPTWGAALSRMALWLGIGAASLALIYICLFHIWAPIGVGLFAGGVVLWRSSDSYVEYGLSLLVMYWGGCVLLGGVGVL